MKTTSARYGSVSDMVRDISEDQAFADEFTKRVASREAMASLLDRTGLTDRQWAILLWIAEFIHEHAYPPVIREICEAFGINSANGVLAHLRALARKGKIVREESDARALRLVGIRWVPEREVV